MTFATMPPALRRVKSRTGVPSRIFPNSFSSIRWSGDAHVRGDGSKSERTTRVEKKLIWRMTEFWHCRQQKQTKAGAIQGSGFGVDEKTGQTAYVFSDAAFLW